MKIVVTAIIKNKKTNKFLIVKRSKNSDIHAGLWVFPGGILEEGESIMDCLTREIKEEVNLNIDNKKIYISDYVYDRLNGGVTLGFCFLVFTNKEEVILNEELDDFKWIDPRKFKDYEHISELDEEIKKAYNIE
ncbi:MAG: NUDIX domain-containing protein [Candidatus Woesearchaeota archaeon]